MNPTDLTQCNCKCCQKWERIFTNWHNNHSGLRNYQLERIKRLEMDLALAERVVRLIREEEK